MQSCLSCRIKNQRIAKKDFYDFENIKIENTFSKKFDVDKFRSLLRLDRIENNFWDEAIFNSAVKLGDKELFGYPQIVP